MSSLNEKYKMSSLTVKERNELRERTLKQRDAESDAKYSKTAMHAEMSKKIHFHADLKLENSSLQPPNSHKNFPPRQPQLGNSPAPKISLLVCRWGLQVLQVVAVLRVVAGLSRRSF